MKLFDGKVKGNELKAITCLADKADELNRNRQSVSI
jgi:hypothetical protein